MEKIALALSFAAEAHKTQKRKDKEQTPYINHPIDVFNTLVQCGVSDSNILAAALLHDTVEDTPATFTQLRTIFDKYVEKYVVEVTNNKLLSKVERKKVQLAHAKNASNGAKLIKTADKLSNLKDLNKSPPQGWTFAQCRGYWVWSYAVLLNTKGVNTQLDELVNKFLTQDAPWLLKLSEEELQSELDIYYKSL